MPLRFRFRLEAILRLKENEEKQAMDELLKIRGKIMEIQTRLKKAQEELKVSLKNRENAIEKGLLKEEELWRRYIPIIEKNIAKLEKLLDEARKEEEKALQIYLEKKRERQSLEKLKERKFMEFLKEIDLQERKVIDEVAERKHWWKS